MNTHVVGSFRAAFRQAPRSVLAGVVMLQLLAATVLGSTVELHLATTEHVQCPVDGALVEVGAQRSELADHDEKHPSKQDGHKEHDHDHDLCAFAGLLGQVGLAFYPQAVVGVSERPMVEEPEHRSVAFDPAVSLVLLAPKTSPPA